MKLQWMARAAVAAVGVLAFSSLAHAQASRTWVSGVGDDANPCSRTAPCKTFAGAISKTATNGYIHALDPGGFGAVTITKSITLDGAGTKASILASLTTGIIINATSTSRVVIRNLDLEGFSNGIHGINVLQVGFLSVENVAIMHFAQNAINMNMTLGSAAQLYLNNVSTRSTQFIVVNNARATINNLHSEGNNKGILVGANGNVTIRHSYIANIGEGIAATAASSVINVENTVIANNTFGISASGGSTIRLSDCAVLSNSNTGLFNDGGSQIISLQGNTVAGNPTPGGFTSTQLKQ